MTARGIQVQVVNDATPKIQAFLAAMPGDDQPTYLTNAVACGYCGRHGARGSTCAGCGATVQPFPDRLAPKPSDFVTWTPRHSYLDDILANPLTWWALLGAIVAIGQAIWPASK